MAFGLYLHIPYCFSKCRYCDFYSAGHSRAVPQDYVNALLRELRRAAPPRPDTLYFGGGTPSLLTPGQLAALVEAAQPLPGAEVTLEANPETVTREKLAEFRRAGANRLSLGVQTARDDSLRRLGRPHTALQSRRALEAAQKAGFDNITGDIMLALPQYSLAEFDETLTLLEEGGARHVSAYLLKIEPGTAFAAHPPARLPGDDEAADFYLYAVRQLATRGYRQYEISNFAKPGFESRHNLVYWNCEDYLGLGPGAHSCMGARRTAWACDTAGFTAGALRPAITGGCTAEDYIMLQLRLAAGLDLTALKLKYNLEFSDKKLQFVEKCRQNGLIFAGESPIRLTPRGMLVQNSILCELLD